MRVLLKNGTKWHNGTQWHNGTKWHQMAQWHPMAPNGIREPIRHPHGIREPIRHPWRRCTGTHGGGVPAPTGRCTRHPTGRCTRHPRGGVPGTHGRCTGTHGRYTLIWHLGTLIWHPGPSSGTWTLIWHPGTPAHAHAWCPRCLIYAGQCPCWVHGASVEHSLVRGGYARRLDPDTKVLTRLDLSFVGG